jgi:hypothetical protein
MTKSDPTYEYKTCRNPNSYLFRETSIVGHKFHYVKRRNLKYDSKFTGFKAGCGCKYKFTTWHRTKDMALEEHSEHIKIVKNQLQFEGVS